MSLLAAQRTALINYSSVAAQRRAEGSVRTAAEDTVIYINQLAMFGQDYYSLDYPDLFLSLFAVGGRLSVLMERRLEVGRGVLTRGFQDAPLTQ